MQDNIFKNIHGASGIKSIKDMIDNLQKMGYIVAAEANYRIADPQYGSKQFFFQYAIEFQDKEQWILHSTTSIRDRINQQQWHSEHIKRLNHYVKRAYVVVPDNLSDAEQRLAETYNQNIVEKRIYSAIDGVVSLAAVYNMIEKKAADLMSSGTAHARLGLNFEKKIVDVLNNEQNFDKWTKGTETSVGYLYPLFMDIMKRLKLNSQEILSLWSTSNIPQLPSGGKPKADVMLVVNTDTGDEIHTFSCKRSNSDWVSVHEYTAETFCMVLNPEDEELRSLLNEFQSVGGVKALGEEKEKKLASQLKKYSDSLSRWVIGGIGGEGDPNTQWAEYIITLHEGSEEYTIYTVEEYMRECESRGIIGQLSTMFRWTYPSGGKGKRIQLKGKVL